VIRPPPNAGSEQPPQSSALSTL